VIGGIPTTYRGVNFRSRLESRWACFFDRIGIRWEYEPFDLNNWVPDFVLIGTSAHVLVEIKPVSSLEDPIAIKAMKKIERAVGTQECLLCTYYLPVIDGHPCIGWLAEHYQGSVGWALAPFCSWSPGTIGFVHSTGILVDRISAAPAGDWKNTDPGILEFVRQQWIVAGNTVQWQRPPKPSRSMMCGWRSCFCLWRRCKRPPGAVTTHRPG